MSGVAVLGPAAWNTMIHLDELPPARPHMVVADDSWDGLGGTSAGKAAHLFDVGLPCQLVTALADDEPGGHVRRSLETLRTVTTHALPTERTERHVNLMAANGDRLSIYTAAPADTTAPPLDALRGCAAVVLDLAPWTRRLAAELRRADLPVWTDLHDVGPDSPWHEPFWRAATYTQCSADNLPDPQSFLHRQVDDGVRLAVCTLGARGAVAVDHRRREYTIPAPSDAVVVDTNGAGDAFFVGVMTATLSGATTERALSAGAAQARRALATRAIAPGLTSERTPAGSSAGSVPGMHAG